jgi:hypothetical protein
LSVSLGEQNEAAARKTTLGDPTGEQLEFHDFSTPRRILVNPVCMPGNVTAVHGVGQFSGDAHKLLILFNGKPLNAIAATTDGFFVRIPSTAHEGSGQLVFADQGPQGWFAAGATLGHFAASYQHRQPDLASRHPHDRHGWHERVTPRSSDPLGSPWRGLAP